MVNGTNLFLLVLSILELLLLQVGYMRKVVKWEGMWVIFVEVAAYGANLVSPDADFVSFHLENGMHIEWMRFAGWILTCPVLLMTLVSMTTADGTRQPAVRLVPLLVANLTMILMGITSAASLAPVKWYVFAIALCFGGVVFSAVIQCFIDLYMDAPTAGTKNTAIILSLTFVIGWAIFPCTFVVSHTGLNVISPDFKQALFVIGDLLSKNCWVGIAVWRTVQLNRVAAAAEENDTEAAKAAGLPMSPAMEARLRARRNSNSNLIISDLNAGQHVELRGSHSQSPSFARNRTSTVPYVNQPVAAARDHPYPVPRVESESPQDENGGQDDMMLLKSVLARYHSMPLTEREALAPSFAKLLVSPGNSDPQNRRQVSEWLDSNPPSRSAVVRTQQSTWLTREMTDNTPARSPGFVSRAGQMVPSPNQLRRGYQGVEDATTPDSPGFRNMRADHSIGVAGETRVAPEAL